MNIIKCTLCSNDSKLIVVNSKLESLILKLLSIGLQHKESEPNLICSACCTTITEFSKFRKKVRKLFRNSGSAQECEIDSPIEEDEDSTIVASNSTKKNFIASESGNGSSDGLVISTAVEPPVTCDPTVQQSLNKSHESLPNETSHDEQSNTTPTQKAEPTSEKRSYSSNDVQQLARHIRSQCKLTKEQRICSKCFTVCDSMKHLYEHRRSEHPEYPCKEISCEEIFSDLSELRTHQRLKHPKKIIRSKCKTCNQKFEDKLSKRLHRCRLKKFKCLKQCGNRFETEEELRTHFLKCRPGVTSIFKCSFCKKILSCSQTLKLHYQKCSLGRISATKSTNVAPQQVVENNTNSDEEESETTASKMKMNGSFKCLKCSEEFLSVGALETHFSTCNGDYSKSIKCSYCGKSFISHKSLRLHKITESHGPYDGDDLSSNESEIKTQENSSNISIEDLKREPECSDVSNAETEMCEKVKTEIDFHEEVVIKEEAMEFDETTEKITDEVPSVETETRVEVQNQLLWSIASAIGKRPSRWDSVVPNIKPPNFSSWREMRRNNHHNNNSSTTNNNNNNNDNDNISNSNRSNNVNSRNSSNYNHNSNKYGKKRWHSNKYSSYNRHVWFSNGYRSNEANNRDRYPSYHYE